eukprot:s239_g5.t1
MSCLDKSTSNHQTRQDRRACISCAVGGFDLAVLSLALVGIYLPRLNYTELSFLLFAAVVTLLQVGRPGIFHAASSLADDLFLNPQSLLGFFLCADPWTQLLCFTAVPRHRRDWLWLCQLQLEWLFALHPFVAHPVGPSPPFLRQEISPDVACLLDIASERNSPGTEPHSLLELIRQVPWPRAILRRRFFS